MKGSSDAQAMVLYSQGFQPLGYAHPYKVLVLEVKAQELASYSFSLAHIETFP